MEGLYSCSTTKSISLLIFSFILLICLAAAPKANAGLQSSDQATKGGGLLSFLVAGDWGRCGRYNQSEVAGIGKELDIDFVVSTGDNFYDNGLTSGNNNDKREDAEEQLLPVLRENGHEHIRYKIRPIPFLTNGAGLKALRGDVSKIVDTEEVSFLYDGQRFMSVELNPIESSFSNTQFDHK